MATWHRIASHHKRFAIAEKSVLLSKSHPVRMQVRCIATARVLMPKSVVRLSAGRLNFGFTDQV